MLVTGRKVEPLGQFILQCQPSQNGVLSVSHTLEVGAVFLAIDPESVTCSRCQREITPLQKSTINSQTKNLYSVTDITDRRNGLNIPAFGLTVWTRV